MTLESAKSGHITADSCGVPWRCSVAAGLFDHRRASEALVPPTPEGPRRPARAGAGRAGARPLALRPPGARRGARRTGAASSGPPDCAQGRCAAPGQCAAPAAPGWGAPVAPRAPPGIWAWGGAAGWAPPASWAQPRPSLQERLRAAEQPMRVQFSINAVEPDAGQAGREALGARRGPSAGPPAERPPEALGCPPTPPTLARAGSAAAAGGSGRGEATAVGSGPLAPVQDATGAVTWTHFWAVDSKILKSGGSRLASPEFQLGLPGHEPTKLALMLNTHKESLGTVGRGRHSFKKSRGCGRVMIKCKGGPLAASTLGIALWLEGDEEEVSLPRPTVQHSFAERSAYEHEWWQLKGDPDQAKLTVGLQLTLAALGLQLALTTTTTASAPALSAPAPVPAAPASPPGLGGAAGAPPADPGPLPGLEVARCAASGADRGACSRGDTPTLQRAAWSR